MKYKTKMFGLLVAAILLPMVFATPSRAALQGWKLVDSGKHLDYEDKSKYSSSISSAIALWEGRHRGIIRKDSWNTIKDVTISDFNEASTTLGITYARGEMKFNDYHFNTMTNAERLKTVTHEFGHALGLDHTNGEKDVMKQGKFEITGLSHTDKNSYDEAYAGY